MSSLYMLLQAGAIALIFLVIVVILRVMRSFRDELKENRSGATLAGIKEVMEAEKRNTDRRSIKIPVIIRTSTQSIKGETKDLSVSGAFIQCQTTIPMGETFQITLTPSTGENVSLTGEVVWSNLNMSDNTVVIRGMGIRFIGLTNTDKELLNGINQ